MKRAIQESNMERRGQRGFTLIELLIALVILAIISSIAVSTFSGSGKDAERSRITAQLVAMNDALGRYYQGNFSYTGATKAALLTPTNGPQISESPYYAVTLTVTNAGQNYTLFAKPVSGSKMVGTGSYSVDQVGNRCYYVKNDNAVPGSTACTTRW